MGFSSLCCCGKRKKSESNSKNETCSTSELTQNNKAYFGDYSDAAYTVSDVTHESNAIDEDKVFKKTAQEDKNERTDEQAEPSRLDNLPQSSESDPENEADLDQNFANDFFANPKESKQKLLQNKTLSLEKLAVSLWQLFVFEHILARLKNTTPSPDFLKALTYECSIAHSRPEFALLTELFEREDTEQTRNEIAEVCEQLAICVVNVTEEQAPI